MTRLAVLVALMAVAATGAAHAERLTTALSTAEVQISSNFTGVAVTVFGVIERDAMSLSRPVGYDVAVAILGPAETVVARRKERLAGIWANRTSETIVGVPAFYSLSTSQKVEMLATQTVLGRLQLGFGNIAFKYEGDGAVNDPAVDDFRAAFIRLKERAGLFHEQVGVDFIGDLIFRTTLWLPANIPVGRYTAAVYLFSGQSLVARAEDGLVVSKIGFEDSLPRFARSQSLLYGLLCVASALIIGWLGGVVFRRD
jgi:uncharacterized protein (TIGR02186 family)